MFESATIRQPRRKNGQFDVGRLLDAMLYYDRVHLILDPNSYLSLVAQLGLPDTRLLLCHPTLIVSLIPEMAAIRKEARNGVEIYYPNFIQWAGEQGKPIDPNDAVATIVAQMRRRGDEVKRSQVDRTLNKANRTMLNRILGEKYSLDDYRSLVSDPHSFKLFALAAARRFGWEVNVAALQIAHLTVIEFGEGAFVASDPGIDTIFPRDEVQDWGLVLNAINDYAIELHLSQALSSDLICSPESAEIAAARIDITLQRATRSNNKIEAFEKATFQQSCLLGRAFSDGRLVMGGALNLIDRSRPMREWLRSLPPDADVFNEYQAALAKEPSFKTVPFGVARFAFFAGIGALVSPIVGVGLSAFDQFILDKLLTGWRPNFFVKNVREFIPSTDANG